MPELSLVPMQVCVEDTNREYHVGDYTQYRVGEHLRCTCKGFRFNKSCKHIVELEKTICRWHEQFSDERQTQDQTDSNTCPACGGRTRFVMVGV